MYEKSTQHMTLVTEDGKHTNILQQTSTALFVIHRKLLVAFIKLTRL
jgi:hypothetical protein